MATATAIIHTYDSWPVQFMASDIGLRKCVTATINSTDVNPIDISDVE